MSPVVKPTLEKGKNAVVSRTMGSKLVRVIFMQGGDCETVETDREERKQWSVTDKEVRESAEMA